MVVYKTLPDRERKYTEIQDVKHTSKDPLAGSTSRFYLNDNQGPVNTFSSMNGTNGFPLSHRHPLTTMNGFPPIRQQSMQQQLCRHYAKGRCYYGDNCKFSHGKIEEYVQRRDERLPLHHTSWHTTRIWRLTEDVVQRKHGKSFTITRRELHSWEIKVWSYSKTVKVKKDFY